MKQTISRTLRLPVILLVPLVIGCSSTATTVGAAGAAAAAAILYTERGAETTVNIGVVRMADATELAFRDLGIALTEREVQPDGIELHGSDGEWKYVVDIERDRDEVLTTTEVTVSRRQVDYSQSRAERVLRTILDRAS